jgi:cysteine desulfurase
MSVYLDCASTTPIDPRVLAAVVHHMEVEYGNAGSRTHDYGARARRAVEQARDQVAAVVAASRGEVLFTSGATESNNLAILGLADHGRKTGQMHLVSTQIEHNAVLEPLQELQRRGFELTLVPPTAGGWVDPQIVRAAVRDDTLLVSVMQVNNETGVIQPLDQIARLLTDHAAYFHVDAAQGFGREIDALRNKRIDLISISGHKLHAPKGVGALVTRRRGSERPPLAPITFGGGQERGLRPGTLPVPLIVGLGLAAELALAQVEQRAGLCRAFRARALQALAPLDPILTGDQSRVVPHILNLSIPGIDADAVMEAVADVASISNGSACTSGATTCSHVLGAMAMAGQRAEGAIRLSWCHTTPEPDWPRFVKAIRQIRVEAPGQG